ncbi:MAG: hypothetical protein IJ660_06985 [Alphaproteobacteria bacterium]|nr:hypothetical protein [Alphaproteobacteria bacterium]
MEQKLKFVTCSGANEFTDIVKMVALSEKFPVIEWGIQVSGKKCGSDSPRLAWIQRLHHCLQTDNQMIQLALHINADWVDDFDTERVSPELHMLLRMRDVKGEPFFQRIQLNFKIGRDKTPNNQLLLQRIKQYGQNRRFILSYNEENRAFIHLLYRNGLRNFDVLYDSSHGEGVSTQEWKEPAFYDENVLQGYAGGLSPENVAKAVIKIKEAVPSDRAFYIDAEGRLKGDDKHLSLTKCEQYLENALQAIAL